MRSNSRTSTANSANPPRPWHPHPPRPSSSTAATQTGRRTEPDTWATVAFGTYHAPPPPPFNDSYLDVRVSAFRHHNEEFPLAIQNQIFNLSIAVYAAIQPIRQAKAPLRLARDLASSKRSLSPPPKSTTTYSPCAMLYARRTPYPQQDRGSC